MVILANDTKLLQSKTTKFEECVKSNQTKIIIGIINVKTRRHKEEKSCGKNDRRIQLF